MGIYYKYLLFPFVAIIRLNHMKLQFLQFGKICCSVFTVVYSIQKILLQTFLNMSSYAMSESLSRPRSKWNSQFQQQKLLCIYYIMSNYFSDLLFQLVLSPSVFKWSHCFTSLRSHGITGKNCKSVRYKIIVHCFKKVFIKTLLFKKDFV